MEDFVIGIQARSNSTRLPGKVLLPMGSNLFPMWYVVFSKCIATGYRTFLLIPKNDDKLIRDISSFGLFHNNTILGPEESPLERYKALIAEEPAERVIRITADCPMISTGMIMATAEYAKKNRLIFVYNEIDGMDVQVSYSDLLHNVNVTDSEHVFDMDALRESPAYYRYSPDLSIDTKEDYERIKRYMDGEMI